VKRMRPQISTREVNFRLRKNERALSILLYLHLRIIFSRIGANYRRCRCLVGLIRRPPPLRKLATSPDSRTMAGNQKVFTTQ
jgi:hypothetical protein